MEKKTNKQFVAKVFCMFFNFYDNISSGWTAGVSVCQPRPACHVRNNCKNNNNGKVNK